MRRSLSFDRIIDISHSSLKYQFCEIIYSVLVSRTNNDSLGTIEVISWFIEVFSEMIFSILGNSRSICILYRVKLNGPKKQLRIQIKTQPFHRFAVYLSYNLGCQKSIVTGS